MPSLCHQLRGLTIGFTMVAVGLAASLAPPLFLLFARAAVTLIAHVRGHHRTRLLARLLGGCVLVLATTIGYLMANDPGPARPDPLHSGFTAMACIYAAFLASLAIALFALASYDRPPRRTKGQPPIAHPHNAG